MGIEVDFISKEFIKPSSPTPHHLQKLEFSCMDQHQFPISVPFIFFYRRSTLIPNEQRCNLLKHSLSKALAVFYPLAGRINNNSYADCNDEGALLIQAKANCELSCILKNRNNYHNNSYKFFPSQPDKGTNQIGSLFQITFFTCGGLAVAFAMPHKLGDALSMFAFLNSWAAIARGNTIESVPFGTSSIFPPIESPDFTLSEMVFKENVITKSFVFDKFTISTLRDKYSGNGKKLSRALALQVFIMNRIAAATSKTKEGSAGIRCMAVNSVNIRQLLGPPVSAQSFGNLAWMAPAIIDNVDRLHTREEYYKTAGRRVQEAVESVNADIVRKMREGEFNIDEEVMEYMMKGGIVRYSLASLCNFPMYEVDFGWGKPEWIASSGLFFDNFIVLHDTRDRQDIEAWITLTEEDMAKFEVDEQLLSHVSSQNSISRL